jgi:hypothetical protein
MKTTRLELEELQGVVDARTKGVEAAKVADAAIKDAKIAELEYKIQLQQLFLEKGLDARCNVDVSTGVVTWPEDETAE